MTNSLLLVIRCAVWYGLVWDGGGTTACMVEPGGKGRSHWYLVWWYGTIPFTSGNDESTKNIIYTYSISFDTYFSAPHFHTRMPTKYHCCSCQPRQRTRSTSIRGGTTTSTLWGDLNTRDDSISMSSVSPLPTVNSDALAKMLVESSAIVGKQQVSPVLQRTVVALQQYIKFHEQQKKQQPMTHESSSDTPESPAVRAAEQVKQTTINPSHSSDDYSASPPQKTLSTNTTYTPITIDPNLPADVRLEQEKKIMAERRRKDLELQRKLQRAQQRVKTKASKIKEMETDKRKQELLLEAQPQRSSTINESIRQINEQINKFHRELQQSQHEIKDIESKIELNKMVANQPLFVYATPAGPGSATPKKEESKLERQKRQAAEARRRQLEQERQKAREAVKKQKEESHQRWLEEERRKEELVQQAKMQKNGLDDLDVMQRLNIHVAELESDKEKSKGLSDSADDGDESANMNQSTEPTLGEPEYLKRDGSQQASPKIYVSPSAELPKQTAAAPEPQISNSSHHTPSKTDEKYTRMAAEAKTGVEQDEDLSFQTELKRNILLQWALQPPHMQVLRPIHELLCSIQTVYPPANGLESHSYFAGWNNIAPADLYSHSVPHQLDEKKLSKALRKLRFFLHPDKLPADLPSTHRFVSQLLWDVTNDAWEDYKKFKEELDWIHG